MTQKEALALLVPGDSTIAQGMDERQTFLEPQGRTA